MAPLAPPVPAPLGYNGVRTVISQLSVKNFSSVMRVDDIILLEIQLLIAIANCKIFKNPYQMNLEFIWNHLRKGQQVL